MADREELFALLGDLVNGTLTPERHARLEALLSESADNRKTYFEYLDLSLGLAELRAPAPIGQLKPRRRRWWIAGAAGLALAAAAALWLLLPRPSAPFVVLAASAGARFYPEESAVRLGEGVPVGRDLAIKEGRIALKFRRGVEVLLEAPAVFVVRDEMHMQLKVGRGSVHVTPGGEGFAVETPLNRIVDLGTRFAVGVDESGDTEVQVLEGATEVHGGRAPGPVRLERGDGRRYRVGSGAPATVALEQGRFPLTLPDRVVRYTATRDVRGGAQDLTSVTVQRGGRLLTYPVEQLTGVDVIHFKAGRGRNFVSTVTDGPDPNVGGARVRHGLLDTDHNLNTGVINPGGAATPLTTDPVMSDPEDPATPNTPGLAVRFKRPVVNDQGPDVVMFEFQPVVQPEHGDPFHVAPLKFQPGLRGHTVVRWDLGVFSPEALELGGFRLNAFEERPLSRTGLESVAITGGVNHPVASKALAVGIDLSSLGYPPGAAVEGLFIQDATTHDGRHEVDPVFIGGLPPLEAK